jgi:DNA-binding Xre family transcriptional regulator
MGSKVISQYVVSRVPFYSSYTTQGALINTLKKVLDARGITSFGLSKASDLSPTTTRKIYLNEYYIPSPDVLERICLTLSLQPGDILRIAPKLEASVGVCSGVLASGL